MTPCRGWVRRRKAPSGRCGAREDRNAGARRPAAAGRPAGDRQNLPLTGTERGWATAQPGRPLNAMIDGRTANLPAIIDEVDRAGGSCTSEGTSASFTSALLELPEPESARAWTVRSTA